MADTEAELLEKLAQVRARRVAGVRSTTFSDRSVTYESDAESRQVEQDLLRELKAVRAARRKRFYGVATKGF